MVLQGYFQSEHVAGFQDLAVALPQCIYFLDGIFFFKIAELHVIEISLRWIGSTSPTSQKAFEKWLSTLYF